MAQQEPDYWLNRDFLASARGSFQHQCLVRRQGYFIHPTIASATGLAGNNVDETASKLIEIADVGAGNGIWTVETCASLSSNGRAYMMTGLDLSDALFPPKQTWPKNCAFDTWDIFTEVPEKYVEKFDIVHARFLLIAFMFKPAAERERALRNMTRLVKPGGWLQWQEPPPPVFAELDFHDDGSCSFRDETPSPIARVAKHIPATQAHWLHGIGDMVREVAGFENVKVYYPPPRREFARYEGDLHSWNWVESMHGFKRTGALNKEAMDELEATWQTYAADLMSGKKVVAMVTIIAIGQKPANAGV